ncbi:MAG: TonB-dependent receptor plug domain-containing protein [Candidatus Pseudobacter hemicellulosilyticus]|uniref:TonB-dependent receptor plug domain-containing protein n=1 Tax=Candidatus Pseudobacter hemicellulosilyticus TaxID=3121375 RepID=A0AAJ6BDY9_9BACT|nr:MAG: TonB-dependent receptor plug domain-containing protein [Pseudobacter sp.]
MRKGALLSLLLCSGILHAQTIRGKLFGETGDGKEILPGGTVQWISGGSPVIVNENGVFELSAEGITDKRVLASCTGYLSDTVAWDGRTYLSITLKKAAAELAAVTVTNRQGARISNVSVVKTEVINQLELSKAACCDLAGCFGTQASVQPQTTNVVTNSQELRILGLSGVYNQVLIDGLPMIQGLTYTYGISTYPGTVVNNIYVSKGTTSVLQGFESISGQINLDTRHPDKTDKLHLNAYINSFGEKHLNANVAAAVGKNKKWHTLLALHSVQPSRRVDGNEDGFMDLPLLTRYMAFNKWKYGNETDAGFNAQFGVRFVHEQRIGGQNGYRAGSQKGSSQVYGQFVSFNQPEAFAKLGYRFSERSALALAMSGSVHNQDSWFGTLSYTGRQQIAYANLQHELGWKKHSLKYGLSYRYQELNEDIRLAVPDPAKTYAGQYLTRLRAPGVFAENTFHWADDQLILIAGARMDRHQKEGWYFTPRTMLKYAISSNHTFRASAGTGWRQVNLFSEQPVVLTSSRNIVFMETLKPEEAMNWGVSHTWRFAIGTTSGTISADFYQTRFQNQFFPDYDADPSTIIIRNFEGVSRSNGVQVDAALTFFQRLEFKAAYNYLDVYRKENNTKLLLPFNPRNRVMSAISFRTQNNKWQADVNAHWFDKMRLPDTQTNPEPYRRPSNSSAYTTVSIQGTYRLKTLEFYAGCENIGNYRQPNPIISAANPFGPYFDLSSVWGPTRGRELYMGVRYSIR